MEMKKYRLKELLVIKNGRDHKDLKEGYWPVYGSGGIMRYVDSFLYDKPSILLPRKGSLNNIQYADKPFWTVDTIYYTVVKENLSNAFYLYNYLKLLNLSSLDSGTGVPSMTFDSYYNLSVNLPCLPIQRKIAAVLSALDNKIALNRRINAKLEQMAKRLYDYWFVQFDFPNAEGKPYKSSGGAMVYNSVLKREIPVGWEISPISKILDKYPTTKKYSKAEFLKEGKFPIVDQDSSSFIAGYTNENDNTLKRFPAVLFGDHSTCVKFLNFEFCRGADGTQILYSNDERISQYYLYHTVKELHIPNPGYSRHFKYLKELPIIIPLLELAKAFKNIVYPNYQKQTNCTNQIVKLTALRDKLLPLLMNGQVTVK
jgi:type I restriction enzyme S subunit